MKNIVLTGFMGTGKTEVGKELSRLLGLKMIDIDNEIEKSKGITINDIFERYGESKFRDIETEMIKKISTEKNLIISTGGGAVLREENFRMLKENGIIVCLFATPETIFERTKNNSDRPLLKVDDPLKKIKELLEYRLPFYKKADIIIDTEGKTPLQIAEEIMKKINKMT